MRRVRITSHANWRQPGHRLVARFATVAEWLAWLEGLHPKEIDLGLERVATVLARMALEQPPYLVLSVAGTNGKGSSVAMLEAILRCSGYRVGAYTSPHLERFSERIRVDGGEIDDGALLQALAAVDRLRGDISLTYFEFTTLAALHHFATAKVAVAVLEVGLGGRLDAVNAVAADGCLLTTVALDHQAWLGDDREAIGLEKAGIFRSGRPAVIAEESPPQSVLKHADSIAAQRLCRGRDFTLQLSNGGWRWQSASGRCIDLPRPALAGNHQFDNAAGVVALLDALQTRLAVSDQAIRRGLQEVRLSARMEVIGEHPWVVRDVAHNPQAARVLAEALRTSPVEGETEAVFAVLADKDAAGIVMEFDGLVRRWRVADLPGVARAAPAGEVAALIRERLPGVEVSVHRDPSAALEVARRAVGAQGRVVVFGSFYTVSSV